MCVKVRVRGGAVRGGVWWLWGRCKGAVVRWGGVSGLSGRWVCWVSGGMWGGHVGWACRVGMWGGHVGWPGWVVRLCDFGHLRSCVLFNYVLQIANLKCHYTYILLWHVSYEKLQQLFQLI
jgi:hypothetical protein